MRREHLYDYFEGTVIDKHPTSVVVECGGVGYRFHIPLSTYDRLASGTKAKILAHLFVREDQIRLYGFATKGERDLFEMLISISGVGPAVALAVLSGSSVSTLQRAVLDEDFGQLQKIKGIGLKTAQRIVLELKGKIERSFAAVAEGADEQMKDRNDAISALISLGFSRKLAEAAVEKARQSGEKEVPVEQLVRKALRFTS